MQIKRVIKVIRKGQLSTEYSAQLQKLESVKGLIPRYATNLHREREK